jgi:hypothetical protein
MATTRSGPLVSTVAKICWICTSLVRPTSCIYESPIEHRDAWQHAGNPKALKNFKGDLGSLRPKLVKNDVEGFHPDNSRRKASDRAAGGRRPSA